MGASPLQHTYSDVAFRIHHTYAYSDAVKEVNPSFRGIPHNYLFASPKFFYSSLQSLVRMVASVASLLFHSLLVASTLGQIPSLNERVSIAFNNLKHETVIFCKSLLGVLLPGLIGGLYKEKTVKFWDKFYLSRRLCSLLQEQKVDLSEKDLSEVIQLWKLAKQFKKDEVEKSNHAKTSDFELSFFALNGRPPTKEEIHKALHKESRQEEEASDDLTKEPEPLLSDVFHSGELSNEEFNSF